MQEKMQEKEPTLSELLAHRDGEPVDLEVARAIRRNARAREVVAHLAAIKSELRELPGIDPPADTWPAILKAKTERPGHTKLPAALAAAAVLVVAVLVIGPQQPTVPETGSEALQTGVQIPPNGDLAALIRRSQELEARVVPAAQFEEPGSSQDALVYRIADIDAELLGLYDEMDADPARQAKLWRQRVDMLENLQTVQQGQAMLRRVVY